MRLCPLCGEPGTRVSSHPLTFAKPQDIYTCRCGMVYASIEETIDYDTQTIYAKQGAFGSGQSIHDRRRLAGVAITLNQHLPPDLGLRILDVGCAQGGLLKELENVGYISLDGLDPSQECLNALPLHFRKIKGTLDTVQGEWDAVVLSHVMEHLPEPRKSMIKIWDILVPGGHAYIEVPDAARYKDFDIPFLDFNSEHINHFSMTHLLRLADGFEVKACGEKTIPLNNGLQYPAIWMMIRKPHAPLNILVGRYAQRSSHELSKMNQRIEQELGGNCQEIILWGAASYLANVLPMTAIRNRTIKQIVDNNPRLWGRVPYGIDIPITGTEEIGPEPIVIASLVGADSIQQEIKKRGLKNKVVTLR